MEDRVQISLLMDLYGPLLTEKQREVMEIYYDDDLSLGEISELNHTSRQATYDLIKRCCKQIKPTSKEYESQKKDCQSFNGF